MRVETFNFSAFVCGQFKADALNEDEMLSDVLEKDIIYKLDSEDLKLISTSLKNNR